MNFDLVIFVIGFVLLTGTTFLYFCVGTNAKESYIYKKYIFPVICSVIELLGFISAFFAVSLQTQIMLIVLAGFSCIVSFISLINKKERNYILFLQKEMSQEKLIQEIFNVTYNETTFKNNRMYQDDFFSIEKLGDKNVILYTGNTLNNWNLLIPKRKISKNEAVYICKQLNMYYNNDKLTRDEILNEKITIFKNKEIYEKYFKQIWFNSKMYKEDEKSKKNKTKRRKIMLTYKKITKEYKDQLFKLIDIVLKNIPDRHFIPYEQWEIESMFNEKEYAPLYGAFDGDKLVGMAQLYVSQDMMAGFKKDFELEEYTVCELGGNLVLPEYRGQGITTTLQKMELEIAKELGFDYIISMAHPDNIASCKTLELD